MKNEELICIVCPNGCHLQVTINDDKTISVNGNRCPRGEKFAIQEFTDPKRTFSTTVKTVFPQCPVVPVKLSGDIRKDMIFKTMEEINKIVLTTPYKCGDVVCKNILNQKVDIIVTSDIMENL